MNPLESRTLSRRAYVQKKLRSSRPRADIKGLVAEGTGLGADIVRHTLLLIGLLGLVAIAAGALTDSTLYWRVLNCVSSLFVRS